MGDTLMVILNLREYVGRKGQWTAGLRPIYVYSQVNRSNVEWKNLLVAKMQHAAQDSNQLIFIHWRPFH